MQPLQDNTAWAGYGVAVQALKALWNSIERAGSCWVSPCCKCKMALPLSEAHMTAVLRVGSGGGSGRCRCTVDMAWCGSLPPGVLGVEVRHILLQLVGPGWQLQQH